ncbi:oxidoreductase [Capsulimonas corticalis]|uniref:Oxidoreductase n=1 Tax=Capsulimonas corticalis TaxID=2219043 RepID=A0A402D2J7_9BACT|nr:zinc-binding alcohol dehydrogenase family protein [Capsulimonas corticalis]BDI29985.1 oxidoreductase [Capsulimonas corticalis]
MSTEDIAMRALRFETFGDPSVLQLAQIPRPQAGHDEVVVQVHASAVNPSDVKNVSGKMPHTTTPRTPGRDFSGVVVEGPAPMVGTHVWGTGGELGFTRDGAHAECLLLPRGGVRVKPSTLSLDEAACVGVGYITAWAALVDGAGFINRQTVLVVGATGAVGSAAVQIAAWRGAHVIAAVRDASREAEARALGAKHVVFTEDPITFAASVKEITDGQGAQVALDTAGGAQLDATLAAMAHKGRVAVIATPDRHVPIDLLSFYRRELRLIGVNTLSLNAADCAHILDDLAPGFEIGALHAPRIGATFSLEEAADAYNHVTHSRSGGKVLMKIK